MNTQSDGAWFQEYTLDSFTGQADLGENLQAQWQRNLGVKLKWDTTEWQAILARLDQQLPHLLIMGWVADYPDPGNFLRARIDHIQQQSGWRNDSYSSLITRAQRSLDQRERMMLYEEAEQTELGGAAPPSGNEAVSHLP